MKKLLFIIAVFIGTTSCTDEKTTVAELSWMEGEWVREFNGNQQLESWKTSNANLIGTSSFITGMDTTLMTTFTISEASGSYKLESLDNGFEEVDTYSSKSFGMDSIVFFNQKSDWPQKIIYKKVSNQMILTISGNDRGMNKDVAFTYELK
jgi:hypothetical protein